jgi:hypothetical protein
MMPASPTKHTWMTRLASHIERPQGAVRARSASSSGARVLGAHFAPAPKARASAKREILDLFGQARPQSHLTRKADI